MLPIIGRPFYFCMGLCLSSSPACLIERNLLVANWEGFGFREQGRTTTRLGAKLGTPEEAVWNHDETVRHNVLADKPGRADVGLV